MSAFKPNYNEKGLPVCSGRICPTCTAANDYGPSGPLYVYCKDKKEYPDACVPALLEMLKTERGRGDALAETLEALERYLDEIRKDLTDARKELCEEKALTMSGMWEHPARAYADTRGWADLFDEEEAP